jgi:hypothetical protein
MVKLASVRAPFIDPNQVGALPDPIVLGSITGYGDGILTRHARIRFTSRLGHRSVSSHFILGRLSDRRQDVPVL